MLSLNFLSDRDFYWRLLIAFCATCIILVACDSAFAAEVEPAAEAAANNDVIGETLCKLVKNLTGGTARAIATLAIFTVGCSLFMGKMDWKTGAMTACGVGIIFGAPAMVGWISSSAGDGACTDAAK